jgi:Ni,Fe-hydrogenase maturation factor
MQTRGKYLVVAWGDPNGGAGAAGLAIAGSLAGEVTEDVEIRCCEHIGPELIADVAGVDHVIFIDAHSRADWPDLVVEEVEPAADYSPEGTCNGPQELVAMSAVLYHRRPAAWLVATRAFETAVDSRLSPRGLKLADAARRIVLSMLPSLEQPKRPSRLWYSLGRATALN